MATVVHADSRGMYSWWWDSHISPKNSKWLQENLSDMDQKIKHMIKLIEEDADSFARRAEMYYKKRPDLLKLVEEFYRAYRALAERYDHATGVLHQAHRSMAEAFPNQVPPSLDDSIVPASSSDHEYIFGDNKEFDIDFVGQFLRKELVKLETEREASLLQYQECLVKMSGMEEDIECTRAENAKIKQELKRVKGENEGLMGRYEKSTQTISSLEEKLADADRCIQELTDQSSGAEMETEILKNSLEKIAGEKESALHNLQNLLFQSEEEIRVLKSCNEGLQEQVKKAEEENKNLKEMTSSSSSLIDSLRGETISLRDIIRNLEKEVEIQVEEQNILHQEIYVFKEKMNVIKEKYQLVMEQVQSVGLDPESVRSYVKKLQDEKLKMREFCDGKLRENATLLEKNVLLETSVSNLNSEFEEAKQRLQDEKSKLKELCDQKIMENATLLEKNALLEDLLSGLNSEFKEIKEKLLDGELKLKELCVQKMKEDGTLLKRNTLLENSLTGLNAELEEVKEKLQDEKLNLTKLSEANMRKNADLLEKNSLLENSVSGLNSELEEAKQKIMSLLEKNAILENSLCKLNKELEEMQDKLKASEESRASLICQLQVATKNSEWLERKSDDSQNSLSDANAEIERLRIMLKKSEESWLLLLNEKLALITERESLSYQLDTTKRRLEDAVLRCEDLERRCFSFDREREENVISAELNKTRMAALESRVLLLQQEALSRNREFKEELDKALNSQLEIFILKNCIHDLEEKNSLLTFKFQKLLKLCESSERQRALSEKSMSEKIQELQDLISGIIDEKFQLLVEKSVLSVVIGKMQTEGMKIAVERDNLYEDVKIQSERCILAQNMLHKESGGAKVREQKLVRSLRKERREATLWETQATDCFCKMMESNFHEAILEEKFHEFTQAKAEECELLGAKVRFLEEENAHLKSKLYTRGSSEVTMQDHGSPLKDCSSAQECLGADSKQHAGNEELLRADSEELQDIKLITHLQSTASPINEPAQHVERRTVPENSRSSSAKSEEGTRQVEGSRSKRHNSSHRGNDLKTRHTSRRREPMKHTNRHGKKPSHHPVHPDSDVSTKDIVLDQMSECSNVGLIRREKNFTGSDERMLELWETTDLSGSIDLRVGISRRVHPSRDSFSGKELGVDRQEEREKSTSRGGRNTRKLLERLNTDAQKLSNLQITVQDLKRKVEITENSETGREGEYREIRAQLEEAEVAILNFFDVNHKLSKSIQRSFVSRSSGTDDTIDSENNVTGMRRRISEQARRGSERIARLQLEVQKIQFVLLKLDDEVEKERIRGGLRTARAAAERNKTRVLLKDFLHVRVRPTLKRKKGQLCSCVQLPSRAK